MKLSELNLLITGLNAQVQKITQERDIERQQFLSERESLMNENTSLKQKVDALLSADPEVPAELLNSAVELQGNVQVLDDRVAG